MSLVFDNYQENHLPVVADPLPIFPTHKFILCYAPDSASSLKQQSANIHVASLGTIILIQGQPVTLKFLMLRA
jgi:hypothetical protein